MRRLFPILLLALVGCTREPAPEPATNGPMGIPKEGGAPVPLGEVSSPQELLAKADIELYPGAETPDKQSNIRRDGSEVRYEIVMLTKDAPEKVLAFYKAKLDRAEVVGDQLMGMTPKGNFVSFETKPADGKTRVTVVVRATEK